jgi:hypothetical protein
MLFPGGKLEDLPRDRQMLEFVELAYTHLAAIWVAQDLKVKYCSQLFAELYDAQVEDIIGTHALEGLLSGYAHDNYPGKSHTFVHKFARVPE